MPDEFISDLLVSLVNMPGDGSVQAISVSWDCYDFLVFSWSWLSGFSDAHEFLVSGVRGIAWRRGVTLALALVLMRWIPGNCVVVGFCSFCPVSSEPNFPKIASDTVF